MTLAARLAALERQRRRDADHVAGAIEDRMVAACGRDEAAMEAWIDALCDREPATAARWIAAYETRGLAVRDGDRWRVVIDDAPWEPRRRRLHR